MALDQLGILVTGVIASGSRSTSVKVGDGGRASLVFSRSHYGSMRRGRLSSGASSLPPRSTHTRGQEASGRIGSRLNAPAQRLTKTTHNALRYWHLARRQKRVKGGPGADASTTSLVPPIAAAVVAPARTSATCHEPTFAKHHYCGCQPPSSSLSCDDPRPTRLRRRAGQRP
jgi:hypothetical protein